MGVNCMDNNIAFSPESAEILNKNVRNLIAKHLFLTCNYNPTTIFTPTSVDAVFFAAALNMYKFLIDSGICNNLTALKQYRLYYNYQEMNNIIQVIKALRTVLGHNLSELNGNIEDKIIVEQWFKQILGKEFTNTEEEYTKALNTIKKYGDDSVKILTILIKKISTFQGEAKAKAISEWERLIINFYKRSSTKAIFEGQLTMYYRARVGHIRKNERCYVAAFVKKMLTFEDKIQELEEYKQQILNIIKTSKKPGKIKLIIDKIDKGIEDIEIKKNTNNAQIAKEMKKESDRLSEFNYYDYYLEKKLPEIIKKKISNNKNIVSLLPQELVQEILDEDFKNVSIT